MKGLNTRQVILMNIIYSMLLRVAVKWDVNGDNRKIRNENWQKICKTFQMNMMQGKKNILLDDMEGWLENLTNKQANNIIQY